MSKIYDANGAKMGIAQIVAEVIATVTDDQKKLLASRLGEYTMDNSLMRLSHSILDTYKNIDSTTEQGMRMRKLLDSIMTKYQKSAQPSADDQSQYNYLIIELLK